MSKASSNGNRQPRWYGGFCASLVLRRLSIAFSQQTFLDPFADLLVVKKDLSKVLMPDHPLYTKAVDVLKLYHQAQADGVVGSELERLRLMAEHRFQAVADYQLKALGGPAEKGH